MVLQRWEPFSQLRRMDRDVDRIWRHMFRPHHTWPRYGTSYGAVPVDVYEDGDHLVVRATIPGVAFEDLEVTTAENVLTIKDETKVEKEVKEDEYLHREHRYGSFSRQVALPRGLDTADAKASYRNGILTVTIPKTEETKPKALKIEVEAADAAKA